MAHLETKTPLRWTFTFPGGKGAASGAGEMGRRCINSSRVLLLAFQMKDLGLSIWSTRRGCARGALARLPISCKSQNVPRTLKSPRSRYRLGSQWPREELFAPGNEGFFVPPATARAHPPPRGFAGTRRQAGANLRGYRPDSEVLTRAAGLPRTYSAQGDTRDLPLSNNSYLFSSH